MFLGLWRVLVCRTVFGNTPPQLNLVVMFSIQIEKLRHTNNNKVIGITRIFVGILILSTGVMKFVSPMLRTAWSGQLIVANIPFYTFSFWLIPIVEIVIGSLLVAGFFSRVAILIVLSILVVATYVHLIADDPSLFPLQPSEPIIPLTLIVLSVMILWRGGGAWSIDGKSASA